MILNDLFTGLVDFRQYVPGIESNTTFDELNPSAINAHKRICNLISVQVYTSLVANHAAEPAKSRFEYLRMAMANLIAKQKLPFDAVANRKKQIETYKYELDAMARGYADNYFNAMDSLLKDLISSNDESFAGTNMYKILSTLPIQTADDFDLLYSIDCSYMFFWRCIPLQREAYLNNLKITYDKVSGSTSLSSEEKAAYLASLNTICAKWTVGLALTRFDLLEFPAIIRNFFSDNTSFSHRSSEAGAAESLSQSLIRDCQKELDSINMQLTEPTVTTVDTQTSFNRPDDKIILMP